MLTSLQYHYKFGVYERFIYVYSKYIDPFFSVLKIKDINAYNLRLYTLIINNHINLKKSYKRKILSCTKTYLLALFENQKNIPPIELLKPYKGEVIEYKNTGVYTLEQFSLFIANCKDKQIKLLFMMLFYLGLRISEAKALKLKDLDLVSKRIHITKQTYTRSKRGFKIESCKTQNSFRALPLPDVIVNQVNSIKYKSQESFLFPNRDKSRNPVISDNNITSYNTKLSKLAELPRIPIHAFRHSCANLLIRNGMTLEVISAYLGHSDPRVTLEIYIDSLPNETDKVRNMINCINYERKNKKILIPKRSEFIKNIGD